MGVGVSPWSMGWGWWYLLDPYGGTPWSIWRHPLVHMGYPLGPYGGTPYSIMGTSWSIEVGMGYPLVHWWVWKRDVSVAVSVSVSTFSCRDNTRQYNCLVENLPDNKKKICRDSSRYTVIRPV